MSSTQRGPVMADLEGLKLTNAEKDFLKHPYLGGIILFARNVDTPEQVANLVSEIRSVRQELIIAVDQEGGRVQRFREGFTRLPAMQCFADIHCADPDKAKKLAQDCGWVMAAEVQSCGVDFSFAPVLDIDKDFSTIIGDRAFSDNADLVVSLAGAFIEGMHRAGMVATGKHFPGHGAVLADSHLETPVDSRAYAEIEARDLKPFADLIQKNLLQGIMPAHVVYSELDSKPAVFSEFWLQEVLRKRLGFNGVIFSDDLCMAGADGMGTYGERGLLALQAGCDMVLVCNNRKAADEVLNACDKAQLAIDDCFQAFRHQGQRYDLAAIKQQDCYLHCIDANLFSA